MVKMQDDPEFYSILGTRTELWWSSRARKQDVGVAFGFN
jgi:hypothetical protein